MIKFEALGNVYTFTKHVNIIGGIDGIRFESGTYKTYFFKMLNYAQRMHEIETDNTLALIDSPYPLVDVHLTSNHCVIIDEANFAPSELTELFETVKRANAYLVVIGRMHVKQLVYPVDSIYKLNEDFSLSQVFTTSSKDLEEHDVICCEDNTSVASLYCEVCKFDVIPARGRSNFYKYIKTAKHPLLIADNAKFGPDLLSLLYKYSESSCIDLSLFLPECFEQILCECAGIEMDNDDYFDLEEAYEKLLSSRFSWWTKNNVTCSMITFSGEIGFSRSDILEELAKVVTHGALYKELFYFIPESKASVVQTLTVKEDIRAYARKHDIPYDRLMNMVYEMVPSLVKQNSDKETAVLEYWDKFKKLHSF